MILSEQTARFLAQFLGVRCESFEKGSRPGFSPQEVECLQNHARAAFRRDQPHHRGDYRAVTVTPEDGALDAERVEKKESFLRRSAVKIQRHFAADLSGVSIAGAIRDEHAKL